MPERTGFGPLPEDDGPARNGSARSAAGHELTKLQVQVEAVRVVLIRLLHDVVETEARLGSNPSLQIAEANEQLVLNALRIQTDADNSASALNAASRAAERDPLTKLPNRVLLLDRLTQAIAFAARHRTQLALMFVDLDRFKPINDTHGHGVGDEVLKQIANRLRSSIRAADTVSRHGGDEFVILLTEITESADAGHVAEKLIAAIAAPIAIGSHVLQPTASLGISVYPDDGEDADTLISRADAAMYRAKRQGGGGIAFHGKLTPAEQVIGAAGAAPSQRPDHPVHHLTELERHNAELREANEKLVVAALSAQELQAAAEEAQRRQAEFISVVANELRNPMAPIRIATSMLGRVRTDEPLLPRAQAIIEQQVAQMARLVDGLHDVAQVNTGKLTLASRQVDMTGVIAAAVDASRPAMDKRHQRFEVRTPDHLPAVNGDPVRLGQILNNLLDNASKFTPDGGEITLTVEVQADRLAITVADNGEGITALALPSIFEPFVQDVHTIGFNGIGLGIGLTVVRALVQAQGGKVTASSAGTSLGSQFVVTLPLATDSPSAPAGEPDQAQPGSPP
jgi:diguanylate cyclase (GGDEF)-like protein